MRQSHQPVRLFAVFHRKAGPALRPARRPACVPTTLRTKLALRVRTAQPLRLPSRNFRQSVRLVRRPGEDMRRHQMRNQRGMPSRSQPSRLRLPGWLPRKPLRLLRR